MGRACAVPKCKTGYKSVKEKCSVFTVPKNIEQFEKWQAAIPNIHLKQSQYVCEKHFERKYILKEWIKRDSKGRIIAQVPYVHPRLVESAVPTIFNSSTASVPIVTDQPTNGALVASELLKSKCGSFEERRTDITNAECAHPSCEMMQDLIPNPYICPHEIVDIGVSSKQESIQSKISSTEFHSLQEFIQREVFPRTEVASTALTCENQAVVDSASIVCDKNFLISNITINDWASDVAMSEKDPITIPTSWGVTEYTEDGGQRVVFSHILRRRGNSTAGTTIDKSVEVETDKTLRYCAYGRLVDSERCQLTPVLTDTTLLLKTLETFKNLNVCYGLGPINIHHLLVDNVFQDSVQRWRDNDCTMICKRKRCDSCKKMRQRTIRREARLKKTNNVHRIRYMSNLIDKRKVIALQMKNSRERCAKNNSKKRIK